jgi:2-oxoglutarate dehydrogenase E2 component (dihydrolipoamide succinyltransferase)
MATEVIMPQLGESVVEGTVIKWLKNEGDSIEEYEPLLEVNTDKVDTEVPAPADGTLLKLYVEEGQTVSAGTLLAVIGESGEEAPEAPPEPTAAPVELQAEETQPAAKTSAEATAGRSPDLGFISPVVARISSEHNVDLSRVDGTGRGGRITKKDVLAYIEKREEATPAEAPWESPAFGELFRPTEEIFKRGEEVEAADDYTPGTVVPLDPVRESIAEHMVRSKHTSPHVTTVMEADLRGVVAHRTKNKEAFRREGLNLTFTAYFISAAAKALRQVPVVNASWSGEGILLHKQVNIGVAVSLGERGLIVPVIRNADQISLRGLSTAVSALAEKARSNQLQPDDVQGGTFTITNHGVSGSLFATPVINQPQCAILGVGAIQKRVVVVEAQDAAGESDDAMAIRPMVYLTLTFDHRIIDGAIADRFLAGVVKLLETWS